MELEQCIDYNILQQRLTKEQINEVSRVIKHYNQYLNEHDNIEEYKQLFGYGYVINWYEGLSSTEDFIKEVKEKLV